MWSSVVLVNPIIICNIYPLFLYTFICLVVYFFQIKFYSVDANISLFCKPDCNSMKSGKPLAGSVLEHDI
jgi:hypothetical protein